MLVAVIALALVGSPSANLRIAYRADAGSPPSVSTLRCPSAAPGCRKLAAIPGDPFAPTPAGTVCSQIYGGPQTARVTGTFRGRKVWALFTRRDGCAIARWNRVAFLFPK